MMGLECAEHGTLQHLSKKNKKKGIPDEKASIIIKAVL